MAVEIMTEEDLQHFRKQLLDDLKKWASHLKPANEEPLEGMKTHNVRQILHCSTGKLHILGIADKLRCKKLGDRVYQRREDVKILMEEGF